RLQGDWSSDVCSSDLLACTKKRRQMLSTGETRLAGVQPRRGRWEAGGKAETVLAAAERAFLASGFGAVTMDGIAREAGVSKATRSEERRVGKEWRWRW